MKEPMLSKVDLENLFNPRSMAIIGVSSQGNPYDWGGRRFLQYLLNQGFEGNIYPVNPKGGEVFGLKIYPDIKDVPDPIDYVMSCISARQTPQLVKDCIAKEVKGVHIFASGFSESGTKEGKALEEEISSLVHQSNIRIIGPNCFGIYCPKAGLSYGPDFSKECGSIALMCQSGGNSIYLVHEGLRRGIRFSKVISYGNACDVNESDLLEYFAGDPDTKIIAAYIEGVKDGRRFYQVLKEVIKEKPIIILKGGITEAGATAAASHTGALAGSNGVWDALFRQAGIIRVYSLEELIDMTMTFNCLPLPSGKRTLVFGIGGGATVLATDDCVNAGLELPRLPTEIQNKLKSHIRGSGVGLSFNNPVDLSDEGFYFPDVYYNCAQTLLAYGKFDLMIMQVPLDISIMPLSDLSEIFTPTIESIIKICKESSKPIAVVIHQKGHEQLWQLALDCERRCYEARLPVFHSLSNAAKSIARFINYHQSKYRNE